MEYLISLSREVSLCRTVCKQLQKAIQKKEGKYGMSTETFLEVPEESWEINQVKDFQRWRKDHRDLQSWQQKLRDYEKVYRTIREDH
jgi:hypothetical protein